MTKVYCERYGSCFKVRARGHAEGSPEVCAAISSLLYALAGYLENDKKITTISRKLDSGDVYISFYGGIRAWTVYDMTLIGLMQIEKSHPDHIKVDCKEIS